jgi:3-deoxy-manno-octulosonate cytidylyltransferase (CMP-KDO synthetase)
LEGRGRICLMRSTIVIPARLASTRLPRKLLLSETGKPLIQHTYEAAAKARRPESVLVAADCEEIAAVVRLFGGQVELTSPDCASGTDRVAEIARKLSDVEIIVNVQGDEPEISVAAIDLAVELLERDPVAVMSTLATPIRTKEKLLDPACVKVVFDQHGRAIYFSRAAIPFARNWDDSLLTAEPAHFHQHIGLYAYRREFLLKLAEMPQAAIERIENLEQLRVLDAGQTILVGVIDEPTIGIDTPEDYRAFVERWRRRTIDKWSFGGHSRRLRMTAFKQQLTEVVASLPDDCTMDDFWYRLYVRQSIDQGMQAIEDGRVYSHDEMREMVKSWRKSSGQNQPATT